MERFIDNTEQFTITTTDRKDAIIYMKALDMSLALHDIIKTMRDKIKYYPDNSPYDFDTLVKVQEDILEIIRDYGLIDI
jgi:hypothetical protein